MKLATRADGAITTPLARILVHPSADKPNWEWTQVSRNGTPAARSPKTYESKSNARRAAERQSAILDPRPIGEKSTRVPVEVYDDVPAAVRR